MKLGEYLQRHVFDVVSVKDATFHLDQREDLRARKAKAWVRTDQGLQEEKNPLSRPNRGRLWRRRSIHNRERNAQNMSWHTDGKVTPSGDC